MWVKGLSRGFAPLFVCVGMASGQTLPTSARIESVPLELTMPERYQIANSLEPIRQVTLVAPADGFIRSMESRLGAPVRESQEIAQLDRAEGLAILKLASAELKEKQASKGIPADVKQAQVEAAQARVDLAKLALDRCTLRAPFTGRVMQLPVCRRSIRRQGGDRRSTCRRHGFEDHRAGRSPQRLVRILAHGFRRGTRRYREGSGDPAAAGAVRHAARTGNAVRRRPGHHPESSGGARTRPARPPNHNPGRTNRHRGQACRKTRERRRNRGPHDSGDQERICHDH